MSYKFLSNIYDPDRPDATEKLLSENYGERNTRRKAGMEDQLDDDGMILAGKIDPPPSPEYVLNYIKENWLSDKKVGLPRPPSGSPFTQEELIEMGYVGVYSPENPPNRRAAPSCGTGTGEALYPKVARYCPKTGEVLEIISNKHTV